MFLKSYLYSVWSHIVIFSSDRWWTPEPHRVQWMLQTFHNGPSAQMTRQEPTQLREIRISVAKNGPKLFSKRALGPSLQIQKAAWRRHDLENFRLGCDWRGKFKWRTNSHRTWKWFNARFGWVSPSPSSLGASYDPTVENLRKRKTDNGVAAPGNVWTDIQVRVSQLPPSDQVEI